MLDFFNQDRPMPLSAAKMAVNILGILLLIGAVAVTLSGLGTFFSGKLLAGVLKITGGLAPLFFIYVVARIMVELLAAMHRMNDRMTVIGDDLRETRVSEDS